MLSGALCHPNIPLLFETVYVICKGSFPKEDKMIHLYPTYTEYGSKMSWILCFFTKTAALHVCVLSNVFCFPQLQSSLK